MARKKKATRSLADLDRFHIRSYDPATAERFQEPGLAEWLDNWQSKLAEDVRPYLIEIKYDPDNCDDAWGLDLGDGLKVYKVTFPKRTQKTRRDFIEWALNALQRLELARRSDDELCLLERVREFGECIREMRLATVARRKKIPAGEGKRILNDDELKSARDIYQQEMQRQPSKQPIAKVQLEMMRLYGKEVSRTAMRDALGLNSPRQRAK
jgi:hypothetical protein